MFRPIKFEFMKTFKRLLLFLFSFGFMFSNCKTKYYTPYDFEGRIIKVGTGGGYTGQTIEYTLLENGQVFLNAHKEGIVKSSPMLERRTTEQIFKNYDKLNFKDLIIDKPGNMYHYLILDNGNEKHKIQWGAHDANPPTELTIYFANLKKILKGAIDNKSTYSIK